MENRTYLSLYDYLGKAAGEELGKKVADAAPEIDKSDKIERLKAQIADGSYKIDYDGLSDIILEQEF